MADGNTSAFNCRRVTGNPTKLSQHSYGNAIDINTRQNPYGTCCLIFPAGWEDYHYSRNGRQGQMMPGGTINNAMAAAWSLSTARRIREKLHTRTPAKTTAMSG